MKKTPKAKKAPQTTKRAAVVKKITTKQTKARKKAY